MAMISFRLKGGGLGFFFRTTAILILSTFIPFSLQGCLSMRLTRTKNQPRMSISFAAFLKGRDARTSGPTLFNILSELKILREGRWELLKRCEKGMWTMNDVIYGKYRIQVLKWAKPDGQVTELGGDNSKTFMLGPGESAKITVILKKTPIGLIIVLAITVVVVVAFLVYLAATRRFPFGVPPPPRLPAPPFPALVFLAFWMPPPGDAPVHYPPPPHGTAVSPDEVSEGPDGTVDGTPSVFDHGPLDQSQNVSVHTKIWLQFSDPIDGKSLDHRNFIVALDSGRVIPGGITYDEQHMRAVYHPLRPLPRRSNITVKVYGQGMRSTSGERLAWAHRWSFTTH
jgi:hypothetical protein